MTCIPFGNQNIQGFICGLPEYQVYICFEHTTYLFEFRRMFGPAWFRMPDEIEVFPEPGGHMGFLWDIFDNMEVI